MSEREWLAMKHLVPAAKIMHGGDEMCPGLIQGEVCSKCFDISKALQEAEERSVRKVNDELLEMVKELRRDHASCSVTDLWAST